MAALTDTLTASAKSHKPFAESPAEIHRQLVGRECNVTKTGVQNCRARPPQKQLQHSPYSPAIAPSDFNLFGPLKKHPRSGHFRTDVEVEAAVDKWLRNLNPDFFCAGFDSLVYR
ncbi:hypothetical protein AVEN_62474-1 [Araneus ventricosus]|uniref:Uncharacterized protein n=1 Tax=Araneus ventricosus TaxID=182803 RepID=A0A4Y2QV57_ARAVE|nr:hypothetical protein AVEN_62474-1 [Araneus ventricosus]